MGSYRDVFAIAAFRCVWLADLVSQAGDRIARVGLAVLVYQRTGSALLSALTVALSFLPAMVGPALSGVADRRPRRLVMITTDCVRAVLTLTMAIPSLPLPILAGLLISSTVLAEPHKAAKITMLRLEVLPGDPRRFDSGEAIRGITTQTAQLIGYAAGGLISGINPYLALVANAGTFVISAILIACGVPAGNRPIFEHKGSYWDAMRTNASTLWRNRRLRTLAWLACLTSLSMVPEALAVPYAAQIGGSPSTSGLLIASDPAGMAVGIFLLRRFLPRPAILPWMAVFAALSGLPLIIVLLEPPLLASMVLFALCGAFSGYLFVGAGPAFQDSSPEHAAAGLMGWFRSGLAISQGLVVVAAGVIADQLGPANAMAIIGAVAVLTGVHAIRMWSSVAKDDTNPTPDRPAIN